MSAAPLPQKQAPPPKRFRRWFRFSLGTLFIVLTIGCVWLGFIANRAQRQRRAVAIVEKLGGRVRYSYEHDFSGGLFTLSSKPLEPFWLRDWLGIDYFDSVVYLDLVATKPSDEDAAALRHLRKVRFINAMRCELSNESCRYLSSLPDLEVLWLNEARVFDEGLGRIGEARALKTLWLARCGISDVGLSFLSEKSELEGLDLEFTQVGDECVERLAKLTRLKYLNLGRTRVSDRGMKAIANLPLESLTISGTRVSDLGSRISPITPP